MRLAPNPRDASSVEGRETICRCAQATVTLVIRSPPTGLPDTLPAPKSRTSWHLALASKLWRLSSPGASSQGASEGGTIARMFTCYMQALTAMINAAFGRSKMVGRWSGFACVLSGQLRGFPVIVKSAKILRFRVFLGSRFPIDGLNGYLDGRATC